MNQKSSLLNYPSFVSRALMSNTFIQKLQPNVGLLFQPTSPNAFRGFGSYLHGKPICQQHLVSRNASAVLELFRAI
jgi:hypothetical protein